MAAASPLPTPTGSSVDELVLFTRRGCEPCDDALAAFRDVAEQRRTVGRAVPVLRTVDVGSDPALESAYGHRVPVVRCRNQELDLSITPRRLARFLERVLDGVTAA
jgi:hypothetical protein